MRIARLLDLLLVHVLVGVDPLVHEREQLLAVLEAAVGEGEIHGSNVASGHRGCGSTRGGLGASPGDVARPRAPPLRRQGARGSRTGPGRACPTRSRRAPRSRVPGRACNRGNGSGPSGRTRRRRHARSRAPTTRGSPRRTPGVSISQPSPGSFSSCAATVVCRPRLSPSRTAEVACTMAAERKLMIVDLPTPLAPRKASVRLPVAYAAIASSPAPVRPLVSNTGTPRATSTSSPRAAAGSSTRSVLVSTTTGSAPESNASTSSRSSRRWLDGVSRACTRKTTSMLAAMVWASKRAPSNDARRTNAE